MRLPRLTALQNDAIIAELYAGFYGAGALPTQDTLVPAGDFDLNAIDERLVERSINLVQCLLNRGSCPFAIEATSQLAAVLLSDFKAQFAERQTTIRLAYSMAIVRFVNGVVDEQQTGMFAESVATLAARIGLPVWLVEIRHAATHQECPTNETLRMATVEVSNGTDFDTRAFLIGVGPHSH